MEENAQRDEFRKQYRKSIISQVAQYLHDTCSIDELKKMYNDIKIDEDKNLFLEQIMPEDREKIL